jgi:hypothetical protein
MNYQDIHLSRKQYLLWEKRVFEFLEEENTNCLAAAGLDADLGFSWHPCECCGSPLGGDRFEMLGFNPDTHEETGPYEVCFSCYIWAAYGEIGDGAMMDISDDAERFPRFDGLREKLERNGWTVHPNPVRDLWQSQTYRATKGGKTILIIVDDEWSTVVHVERAGER